MDLLAMSAILPSLLLLGYFHKKDAYPEPGRVIWTTFALGVLTVVPVLGFGAVVAPLLADIEGPVRRPMVDAFVLAAIPEEFFKLMVLLLYSARRSAFDEPMDGIVYGVAASLGFATLENVLYVSQGGLGTAIMRAVTAVPAHALLGALMGTFVGRAKFSDPSLRPMWLGLAYVVPMIVHGLYDFPLLAVSSAAATGEGTAGPLGPTLLLVPLTLIGLWWSSLRQVRILRKEQEAKKGPTGTLEVVS